MKTLSYGAGEVIFREGDLSETMYEIQRGRVGVVLDYGTEGQKQIAELGEGQFLGEMGLIEDSLRSATAVSVDGETILLEITEDEIPDYFRNNPDRLLAMMRQMSSRIRERTQQYFDVCRALADSVSAEKNGTEKDEALKQQLDEISKTAEKTVMKRRSYNPMVNTELFRYVLHDLESTEGNRELVNASLFERLKVRYLSLKQMHVNPDDEFCDPDIGPSERVLSEYGNLIRSLQHQQADIFEEPVLLNKMKQGGYMLLNGHHRWAAAWQRGLSEIRAKIINPS